MSQQETNPKDKARSESSSLFEIVAGAYERILYGLEFCEKGKQSQKKDTKKKKQVLADELPYSINPFFIFPAHIGCIKTVAVGQGRYLASGSTDEFIKLYDMKARKELGSLQEHKGSITCLEFIGKTHLVSGSEDSTLMVWRTKDWEVLKTLKGHTGKIHSISVHPSGKLALTVGSDRLMFLWNMMTGQKASSIRLPKIAEIIRWNKSGDLYAVMYEGFIEIYRATKPDPFIKIESSSIRSKFMALEWDQINSNHYISVGCSDGALKLFGPFISNSKYTTFKTLEIQAHPVRIKAIKSIDLQKTQLERLRNRLDLQDEPLDRTQYLTTVSSDGSILVWDLEVLVGRLHAVEEESTIIQLKSYVKDLNKTKEENENNNQAYPSGEDISLILAYYFANVRLTCASLNFPYF